MDIAEFGKPRCPRFRVSKWNLTDGREGVWASLFGPDPFSLLCELIVLQIMPKVAARLPGATSVTATSRLLSPEQLASRGKQACRFTMP